MCTFAGALWLQGSKRILKRSCEEILRAASLRRESKGVLLLLLLLLLGLGLLLRSCAVGSSSKVIEIPKACSPCRRSRQLVRGGTGRSTRLRRQRQERIAFKALCRC
jgi:hypothetical protein